MRTYPDPECLPNAARTRRDYLHHSPGWTMSRSRPGGPRAGRPASGWDSAGASSDLQPPVREAGVATLGAVAATRLSIARRACSRYRR